jgi:putative transposase
MFSSGTPHRERHLHRLSDDHYRGFALVHWTMTIAARQSGWLTPDFHAEFRLLLLHACSRFALHCPVYCLMPDHVHLLWLGVSPRSDQKLAIRFLRQFINAHLGPQFALQHQAFDHVLNADERECGAFENVAAYIRENPERAELVKAWPDWPYAGCMLPGYPDMHAGAADFWRKFWGIHHRIKEKNS